MNRRLWTTAMISALASVAACAFPTIDFIPGGNTDGGGATTGGQGGVGGMTTSTGGQGGVGGEQCQLGAVGACEPGKKCTVTDTNSGTVDCSMAGSQAPWTKCFGDADCSDGDWCDIRTNVCHPVCNSSNECGGGNCIPAKNVSNQDIPGLKICTPNCAPINGSPCSSANGPVTCFYDVGNSLWDCIETENHTEGTMCTANDECGVGMACPGSNTCRRWCNNPNDWCITLISFCVPTDPEVTHDGTAYGLCD